MFYLLSELKEGFNPINALKVEDLDLSKVLTIKLLGDEIAYTEQLGYIDVVLEAKKLAKIKHIFSGDVARSPLRVWATTNACDRTVDCPDSVAKRDDKIFDGTIISVVEVSGEIRHLKLLMTFHQLLRLLWGADSNRIA